jgi:hypothetical protein
MNKGVIVLGAVGGISLVAVAIALATRKKTPGLEQGYLCGYIKDADTGDAIAFASVTLGDESAVTNSQGYYELPEMSTGNYNIDIVADGYPPYYGEVNLGTGKNTRNYNLSASGGGGGGGGGGEEPAIATLYGNITDWSTAQMMEGVHIEINGKSAIADKNGNFNLTGIPSGVYTVNLTQPDTNKGYYNPLSVQITLNSGNNYWFFAMTGVAAGFGGTAQRGDAIIPGQQKYPNGADITNYSPSGPTGYFMVNDFVNMNGGWYYLIPVVMYGQTVNYPYIQEFIENPIYWR